MEFEIEQYNILKSSGFNGFEINFEVDGQAFLFMLGYNSHPFTLGVKHQFKIKGNCPLCGKVVYPSPIGQQPCTYFTYNKQQELLEYFALFLP
ncbi:hypothetical protein ACQCVH_24200 [Bacillus infantis]|uniref:hypothetical protein n=1 Tax=Bacillus infantis TaxID=324767 RepID=UPI003CED6592